MSRGIRYRVWDIDNKEFVYISETPDGEIWINNGISTVVMPEHKGPYEQSTGLEDKNGKEIWVGDIVRLKHSTTKRFSYDDPQENCDYEDIKKGCFEIDFNENMAAYVLKIIGTNLVEERLGSVKYDVVVVGNVHENLETSGDRK